MSQNDIGNSVGPYSTTRNPGILQVTVVSWNILCPELCTEILFQHSRLEAPRPGVGTCGRLQVRPPDHEASSSDYGDDDYGDDDVFIVVPVSLLLLSLVLLFSSLILIALVVRMQKQR